MLRGGWAAIAGRAGRQGLNLAALPILSRALGPADFGGFAIFLTVFDLGALLIRQGVFEWVSATPDARDAENLFWPTVIVGLLLGATCGFVAFFLPAPYNFYARAWAACWVLFATGLVPHALLYRDLDVRFASGGLCAAEAVGTLGAFVIAFRHGGVNALIFRHACTLALSSAFWLALRPRCWRSTIDVSLLRRAFFFQRDVSLIQALGFFERNAANLILTWRGDPISLGLYTLAYRLVMAPISTISGPLIDVALPQLRHEENKGPFLRRWISTNALLVGPVFLALALFPAEVLRWLAGPGWTAAAPILAVLAVAGFVQSFPIEKPVLVLSGRTRDWLHLVLWRAGLVAAGVAIGSSAGARGVAVGYLVATVLAQGRVVAKVFWRPNRDFIRRYNLFGRTAATIETATSR